MEEKEIVERLNCLEKASAIHAEKIDVANHRIDDLEEETKGNRELIIAVKEIATEMKHIKEDQADMNRRLQSIEDRPSKNWDKVVTTIIGTVVGAIIGAIIGLVLK